ncbi:hypothetical protein WDW86_16070 [Bdellovibrionota bacterium FG-2]
MQVEGNPGDKYGVLQLSNRAQQYPREEKVWHWFPPHHETLQLQGDTLAIVGHPANHPPYPQGELFKTIKKMSGPCQITGGVSTVGRGFRQSEDEWTTNIDIARLFSRHEWVQGVLYSTEVPTNCAISGGNSGSPALDANSFVIGIMHFGTPGWYDNPAIDPASTMIPMSEIFNKYGAEFRAFGIIPETERK